MAAERRDSSHVACCCCTMENESCNILTWFQNCLQVHEDGWYFGACCRILRVVGMPVLFTLAILVIQATDCDIGTSRIAAGSLLLPLILLEIIIFFGAKFLEKKEADTWLKIGSTILEVVVLSLLMVVSVSAITRLPSDCNKHGAQSLELVAAASVGAMLVVQFYLAVNCKTNARWHSCSIVVRSDEHPAQVDEPEMRERRLFCLECDVPEGGSTLAKQAGLTQSLSCLQVLLSLLGWALLLAGCVLLFSNYATSSTLVTAAGALTVVVAALSMMGGWIGFLGETALFIKENSLGRRRLDWAVLVLTTALLTFGAVDFSLLVVVAAKTSTDVHEASNSTLVKPGTTTATRATASYSTFPSNMAVREVGVVAYVALAVLLLLLLLAVRNNVLLCRCQNLRCCNACAIVLTDPEHAQEIHADRQRPRDPTAEAEPLDPFPPGADPTLQDELLFGTRGSSIYRDNNSPPSYRDVCGRHTSM